MPSMLPSEKPRLHADELRRRIAPFGIDEDTHPLVIVGIRGYYRDTMGAPMVNDRGIYDDALFILSRQATVAFNGNTDPSRYRAGQGTSESRKGMASLMPGAWFVHRFDLHNGKYLALCQRAGEVTVMRDGNPPYRDTGDFGINIHRGGINTTSSLGCQTLHPSQWDSFITLAVDQAKRYHGAEWKKRIVPYVLLDA